MGLLRRVAMFVAVTAVALVAFGCKPQVGDACKLSTDCSVLGDRLCDTSQPEGYCTIFNCDVDTCPGESVCVEFHPESPRFSRRFCVRGCDKGSDCRPGYACVSPVDRDGKMIDSAPGFSTVCLP